MSTSFYGYGFVEHACTEYMEVVTGRKCLVGVFAIVFAYYVVAKENRARQKDSIALISGRLWPSAHLVARILRHYAGDHQPQEP